MKGKRTFLEWPRCPAASVAALSAAQSAEHWASVIVRLFSSFYLSLCNNTFFLLGLYGTASACVR